MTKETVKLARETFGKNPIRLIGDNMIVVWDNTPNGVNLIWDDDNERVIYIAPTMTDNLVGSTNVSPLTVEFFEYEQIQYMEGHLSKEDAMKYAISIKSTVGDDEYQKILKIISKGNEGYVYKYVQETSDDNDK